MTNTVLVTREPPIAVVQLNRPEVLNALNEEVLGELVTALKTLDDDDEIASVAKVEVEDVKKDDGQAAAPAGEENSSENGSDIEPQPPDENENV